jgi:hypothetical protein
MPAKLQPTHVRAARGGVAPLFGDVSPKNHTRLTQAGVVGDFRGRHVERAVKGNRIVVGRDGDSLEGIGATVAGKRLKLAIQSSSEASSRMLWQDVGVSAIAASKDQHLLVDLTQSLFGSEEQWIAASATQEQIGSTLPRSTPGCNDRYGHRSYGKFKYCHGGC